MKADRLTGTTRRVALTLGCLALVASWRSWTPEVSFIAFSIFYVVPIALAAWYGDRTIGLILAVSAGLGGLAAELSSLGAHHPSSRS